MRHLLVASILIACAAAAAADAPQFSREVGKPLAAAQIDIRNKKWDSALIKIREAEAVKKKTTYEVYSINELKAYALLGQRNYAAAARVYEQNLQSSAMPASKVEDRLKTLTTLYVQLRNNPKIVEYCKRWIAAGGASDPEAHQLLAQAYFQQKDYRHAIGAINEAMSTARRRGKRLEQNWLILKLNSYYALDDDKGVLQTREELVRTFPSREHWSTLLDMQSRGVADDRAKLNFYRLMLDLGVLKKPADYVEMAQMMMDQEFGVPGEAVLVIRKGFANKVLDNKDRSRHERVLTAAEARAQAARKLLPVRMEEARASSTGEPDLQLGALYLSYGKNEDAIAALKHGLKKGGLKDANDARMLLGLAYFRAGHMEESHKAFKSVSNDCAQATIADLWAIRVQQSR